MCLGRFEPHALLRLFKRLHDHDSAGREIHVLPTQAENLAPTKPRRNRQHDRHVQTALCQETEQITGLILVQRPHLLALSPRGFDRLDRGARQELPFQRLGEGFVQQPVEMHDALGRE